MTEEQREAARAATRRWRERNREKVNADARNKTRAILCQPCNLALGLVQDCPERLAKLIIYLAEHNDDD